MDEARQDFIYLYGMPVAVLFSSDEASPADCGLNFIVPNHLGAALRLLDSSGNVTQSPEIGPYDGTEETGWSHTNGPQYSDILARFDSSSALIPLGGLGTYTSTSCSGGDCPATTYTQTIQEAGAIGFQLNLNISGIDPCSDSIQVSGSNDAANGVTTETILGTTTGSYATMLHYGTVTVSLLSNITLCGTDDCTCNSGDMGSGTGFQITSANVQYSSLTDPVGLSLPGMYDDGLVNMPNNWNRYLSDDMQIYTQPDPMMAKPAYMRTLLKEGLWNPAYGYAGVDPMMFIDPTGLDDGGAAAGSDGGDGPTCGTIGDCVAQRTQHYKTCATMPLPLRSSCQVAAEILFALCVLAG